MEQSDGDQENNNPEEKAGKSFKIGAFTFFGPDSEFNEELARDQISHMNKKLGEEGFETQPGGKDRIGPWDIVEEKQ